MSDQQKDEKIDPLLLERLGRICVRWAVVEELSNSFLAFAVSADRAFLRVVTQNVSNSSVVDWLRVLSENRFTDERSRNELAELFRRIDETRRDRNDLVHGIWHAGSEPNIALVHTLRMDRTVPIQDKLVTLTDLDDLIDEIEALLSALTRLGNHLGFTR